MSTANPQPSGTPSERSFDQNFTRRTVTTITAAVVGLTFLFGFGNVWVLARHLGVTPWVAPLVAPAVDLSVIGLLLSTWHLALHGAHRAQLRPARRSWCSPA
jgi:DMSO reductase anchor subunit